MCGCPVHPLCMLAISNLACYVINRCVLFMVYCMSVSVCMCALAHSQTIITSIFEYSVKRI